MTFEGVLRQAASIRDSAKAGVFSDEERRQRVGDAADLIMGLMGKICDFEDDSETDGELNRILRNQRKRSEDFLLDQTYLCQDG
jgi:hypothetical protein